MLCINKIKRRTNDGNVAAVKTSPEDNLGRLFVLLKEAPLKIFQEVYLSLSPSSFALPSSPYAPLSWSSFLSAGTAPAPHPTLGVWAAEAAPLSGSSDTRQVFSSLPARAECVMVLPSTGELWEALWL